MNWKKRFSVPELKPKTCANFGTKNYKEYMGVTVKNDAGHAQDVHWSHGSFGYFPTYSLGSFYAAQFHQTMLSQHPTLEKEVAKGDFTFVHQWLKSNIYRHGKTYNAEELCKKATGQNLNFSQLMHYVMAKYQ